MIKSLVTGKVYVFIDAENVFYAQRTFGWKISYQKLMKYFQKECGKETIRQAQKSKEKGIGYVYSWAHCKRIA
jgi:uncharacterized LabA/DUF88 family protein